MSRAKKKLQFTLEEIATITEALYEYSVVCSDAVSPETRKQGRKSQKLCDLIISGKKDILKGKIK